MSRYLYPQFGIDGEEDEELVEQDETCDDEDFYDHTQDPDHG